MKTITIPTTNRLPYFLTCMSGLAGNPELSDWKVIVLQTRKNFSPTLTEMLVRNPELDVSVVVEDCPTPDEAVYRLHDLAYGRFHSDANLFVCDDFRLESDALELCDWWLRKNAEIARVGDEPIRDCLSLCLSCANRPSDKSERLEILRWFHAGAFLTTRNRWVEYFASSREVDSRGWDYSINSVLAKHKMYCLFPAVSRANEFGRCGNAHLTPADFKARHPGIQLPPQHFDVVPEPLENKP